MIFFLEINIQISVGTLTWVCVVDILNELNQTRHKIVFLFKCCEFFCGVKIVLVSLVGCMSKTCDW